MSKLKKKLLQSYIGGYLTRALVLEAFHFLRRLAFESHNVFFSLESLKRAKINLVSVAISSSRFK